MKMIWRVTVHRIMQGAISAFNVQIPTAATCISTKQLPQYAGENICRSAADSELYSVEADYAEKMRVVGSSYGKGMAKAAKKFEAASFQIFHQTRRRLTPKADDL